LESANTIHVLCGFIAISPVSFGQFMGMARDAVDFSQ
jgi:hypothetical protein